MKKGVKYLAVLGMLLGGLAGCKTGTTGSSADPQPKTTKKATALPSFDQAEKEAKGKTVTFYGYGGSDTQNAWVDGVIAPQMKEKYNITVKRIPMNIEDIMNKLVTEKEAQKTKGDIDTVWINGENFYTAKQGKLLAGPLLEKIPNVQKLMNVKDPNVVRDFQIKTDGYEVPFGTAQMTFIGSKKAFAGEYPTSAEKLLSYAKAHPGRITYPAPPEFTGSAFVRNLFCDIVGFDVLNKAGDSYDELLKVSQPAVDWFNEIKPFLWQEGKTYPTTASELDELFADGQLDLTFNYAQMHNAAQQEQGKFTSDAQSFLLDKGTITNYNYLAVSETASEKGAALLLINEMIAEESMKKKAELQYGGAIPPYDFTKVDSGFKRDVEALYANKGEVSLDELQSKQIPELSAKKIPVIEKIWQEQVLNAE